MQTEIHALVEALGSPDNDTQRQAESKLIRIGAPAVDALIAATGDAESQVRWRAAYALGEIGDARAYDALLALLTDNAGVRAEAVDAVAKIGCEKAIEPLAQVVRNAAEDVHAATHAAHHLMFMGTAALPALLDIWQTGTLEARTEVAYPIGDIGDPSAADSLAEQLDNTHLRMEAACALGMLGDSRALDILIGCVRDDWQEYAEGEHAINRGIIGLGLAAIGSLVELAKTGSPQQREKAVGLIGEIGNPAAIGALTDLLDDQLLHHEVIIALGMCGDERVLPELMRLIAEADEDYDISIVHAVSKFGAAVVSELEALSKRGSRFSCQLVASALGEIASDRCLDVLTGMLRDPDDDVREWVLDAIQEIGDSDLPRYGEKCAALIESCLDDATFGVRWHAAHLSRSLRKDLGQQVHPKAIALLD